MTKKPTKAELVAKEARQRAESATHAVTMSAITAWRFAGIVGEIGLRILEVTKGDMREPERMLMGQAMALQSIFANLANRAALNMGEHLDATERYMRLALKAQAQCRATLETLAILKNPPLVIARQANVTTGPQQINNGMAAPSRAREVENRPNELLEANDGERMDSGATGAASGADPAMAALGTLDRAANR
jgi:hypothetical protein